MVQIRIDEQVNAQWEEGCDTAVFMPCKTMNIQTLEQNSPFCVGDSALLRVGFAGGNGVKTILWSNGAITKRTYAQQGETLSVTVTDASGCSLTDSVTASTLNTSATLSNFTLDKLGATVFRGSWNPVSLQSGESLIGYRMAYRLRNNQSWTNTPLTIDTFSVVDFAGSGKVAGNYEFVAFTRYFDGTRNTNSNFSCKEVKGYNGSGNKSDSFSLDGENEEMISIYPNPTKNILYVQCPLGSSVQLMDIQGKLLAEQIKGETEISFEMSYLAQGVYMVKITSDDQHFTQQVVKN
jgi:hypothetical protein